MGSKKYNYPIWYMREYVDGMAGMKGFSIYRLIDDKGRWFKTDFYLRADSDGRIYFRTQMDVEKYTVGYGRETIDIDLMKRAFEAIFNATEFI